MSGTVTFDGAPPPGTINLGLGHPSADLLPVDLVRQASQSFFDNAVPFELNYGVMQGDERFLGSLAAFLTDGYCSEVTSDQLFVTGGNSQALDLVSVMFANPGDTVFVEEPSFFLAFQIFRDHGLNIVGIPVDDDGLGVDAIRRGAGISQAGVSIHDSELPQPWWAMHFRGAATADYRIGGGVRLPDRRR